MKAVVCIDLNDGIAFNHRRISQDIKQREDLLQWIDSEFLYIDKKATALYGDHPQIIQSENPVMECKDHWCLFENNEINKVQDQIDTLLIYNWNRNYPSDSKLDIDLWNYKIKEQTELGGKSHEKITRTLYVR